MSEAFKGRTEFTAGIDVSNVTNMKMMFRIASAFNQPIETGILLRLKTCRVYKFFGASLFESSQLEPGIFQNVVNMREIFRNAFNFDNQFATGMSLVMENE